MAQGKCTTKELEELRKQRISNSLKGKTKSKEHIEKIIKSRRRYTGDNNPNYRGVIKQCICENCKSEFIGHYGDPKINKGLNRFCSRKCKYENMKKICGKNHPRYKDGTYSHGNRHYKYGTKNKQWRLAVLERDNYQCVKCGNKHELHVDHIIPFKDNKELRYEITNGRTLCKMCHYEITFRKSPLNNWKAYSRWAMVTRGKPSEKMLQPQRLSEETAIIELKR